MRLPSRPWLIGLLAAACLTAAAPLSAQTPDDRPDRPRRDGRDRGREGGRGADMVGRLLHAVGELDLTPDQQEKLKTVREDAREQMQSLRQELRDLPPEERREKVAAAAKDIRDDIDAVLTPDQKEKLKAALAAPTTRPGGEGRDGRPENRPEGRGRGAGMMIDRLRDALADAGLSPEQQKQTDAILADAQKRMAALRESAPGDVSKLREEARALADDTRSKLAAVLTPEQRKAVLDAARPQRPEGPPPGPRDAPPGDAPPPKSPDAPRAESTQPSTPSATAGVAFSSPASPAIAAVGDLAPDFSLGRIDGKKTVTRRSLAGKPSVIVFGSFTSPTFRAKTPAFEALRKKYRDKVNVLVVYTREAYAADEWDVQRNIDAQISVAPHATLEDRTALARKTAAAMDASGDWLVDDVDDAVVTAYDAFPNGCVILDARGHVTAKQKWADADGAKAVVDDLLNNR